MNRFSSPRVGPLRRLSLVGTMVVLAACGAGGGSKTHVDGDGNGGATFPRPRDSSEPDVRRLLLPEVVSTLTDLLAGTATMASAPIQSRIAELPNDQVSTLITDVGPDYTTPLMTPLLDLVYAVATSLSATPGDRQLIAGSCAATFPWNDACTEAFLNGFGSLALRRPLTADDVALYSGAFASDGANQAALVTMLSRILLGPEFLHIVAYGNTAEVTGRYLTPWEVASRLSYRITGTMPDAALRATAADGSLADPATVQGQVERLIQTPAGRAQTLQIFARYLGVARMEQPYSFFANQLAIIDTQAFQGELAQELQDYVAYMVLDSDSTFADFVTSSIAFPRSSQMAAIYGTKTRWTGSGTPPTATNGQQGIAMRAAVLTEDRADTAPLLRGVFLRKQLLCDPLGSPDADAVAAAVAAVETDPVKDSNRQIYTAQTASPQCQGCHARIDPPGFALEGFDSMGRPRPLELVYDANNKQVATHPIDTRVDDLLFAPPTVVPASSASDLANALAAAPDARACVGKQLFRFTRLQVESAADMSLVSDLEADVNQGKPLHDVLVHSFANADVFWKR